MIHLQRLEGFYRVAKAGGYARAVREFPYPITQPAVHRQVRLLEQDLGQRLLARTAKDRMSPTPAGRYLYDFCAPFFEELPRVARAVTTGRHARTLRVDAGPQEIRHVLPQWLRRLRTTHPDVRIELTELSRVDAQRLRTGEADLVVEHWPAPPPDVAQRRIGMAYGHWIVPSHLARGSRIQWDELREAPFVGFPAGTSEHDLQLSGLTHAGLSPSCLLSASTVDAILGFVQAGLGYSLVSWPSKEGPRLAGVVSERIRAKEARFAITASWLRGRDGEALVRELLGETRER